jgi:hypothetical protein
MRAMWAMVLMLAVPLVAANDISLHGSGTTNPSKYFWKVMDTMEARSKVRTPPPPTNGCASPALLPMSPPPRPVRWTSSAKPTWGTGLGVVTSCRCT